MDMPDGFIPLPPRVEPQAAFRPARRPAPNPGPASVRAGRAQRLPVRQRRPRRGHHGRSDLDLTLVLRDPPSPELAAQLETARLALQARHPEVSKIDFDIGHLDQARDPANRDSWGYWLKHRCRCLWGEDLASALPPLRPAKAIALALNGDYAQVLEDYARRLDSASSEERRRLQREAAKKLIRSSDILRGETESVWPETLEHYLALFRARHPDRRRPWNISRPCWTARSPTRRCSSSACAHSAPGCSARRSPPRRSSSASGQQGRGALGLARVPEHPADATGDRHVGQAQAFVLHGLVVTVAEEARCRVQRVAQRMLSPGRQSSTTIATSAWRPLARWMVMPFTGSARSNSAWIACNGSLRRLSNSTAVRSLLSRAAALALGADFRQQLRQLRTQVETLHQLHAMVARLDRAERAAGLVLLETHPGQHLLAVANDRFDGAVVGFQHQQRALASPPTRSAGRSR